MSAQTPNQQRHIIRENSFVNLTLDASGTATAEKILERLDAARLQATKEANRLLLISMAFCGLYLVKVSGLRADLVILDQKVFEVPYGIFIFCICAQLAFGLNCIRSLDARVYDCQLHKICDIGWPSMGDDIYATFPNQASWSDAGIGSISDIKDKEILSGCLSVFMFPSALFAFALMISPALIGFYYIIDWRNQIVTGNIDLQYYSVVSSTTMTLLLFIHYVSVHALDKDS